MIVLLILLVISPFSQSDINKYNKKFKNHIEAYVTVELKKNENGENR
jgi:hypothetical protein